MSAGGIYYGTAVQLREMAKKGRESYPEALAERNREWTHQYAEGLHPAMLIVQSVGFEIAAALWGIAQALEDKL